MTVERINREVSNENCLKSWTGWTGLAGKDRKMYTDEEAIADGTYAVRLTKWDVAGAQLSFRFVLADWTNEFMSYAFIERAGMRGPKIIGRKIAEAIGLNPETSYQLVFDTAVKSEILFLVTTSRRLNKEKTSFFIDLEDIQPVDRLVERAVPPAAPFEDSLEDLLRSDERLLNWEDIKDGTDKARRLYNNMLDLKNKIKETETLSKRELESHQDIIKGAYNVLRTAIEKIIKGR